MLEILRGKAIDAVLRKFSTKIRDAVLRKFSTKIIKTSSEILAHFDVTIQKAPIPSKAGHGSQGLIYTLSKPFGRFNNRSEG